MSIPRPENVNRYGSGSADPWRKMLQIEKGRGGSGFVDREGSCSGIKKGMSGRGGTRDGTPIMILNPKRRIQQIIGDSRCNKKKGGGANRSHFGSSRGVMNPDH